MNGLWRIRRKIGPKFSSGYYAICSRGSWSVLLITTILLEWVVPFVVLLSQPAKMSRTILLRVAIAVLAGDWLDLYVGIFPSITATPRLGAWEIVALCGRGRRGHARRSPG